MTNTLSHWVLWFGTHKLDSSCLWFSPLENLATARYDLQHHEFCKKKNDEHARLHCTHNIIMGKFCQFFLSTKIRTLSIVFPKFMEEYFSNIYNNPPPPLIIMHIHRKCVYRSHALTNILLDTELTFDLKSNLELKFTGIKILGQTS